MASGGGAVHALAVVFVAIALSGCLGGGEPKEDAPAGTDLEPGVRAVPIGRPGDGGSGANRTGAYAFNLSGAPHSVLWANGTAKTMDAFPASSLGEPTTYTTDLAALVEPSVPTMIVVNLSYERPPSGGALVQVHYDGRTAGGSQSAFRAPSARQDLEVQFVPDGGGPYSVEVSASGVLAQDLPYQLRIMVMKMADHLMPGTPAELELVPGGGFVAREAEPPTGDGASLVTLAVWGPDDEFLGRFSERSSGLAFPVARDGKPGKYVVALLRPAVGVRIEPFRLAPANMALRALDVVQERGETRDLSAGATNWTFTPARTPLAVGVQFSNGTGGSLFGGGPDYDGNVTTAAGPVFDFDGPPSGSGGRPRAAIEWSASGEANLTAGKYEVNVVLAGGTWEAREVVRYYVRDGA